MHAVLVNYRTPDLTLGALASLAAAREAGEAELTAAVVENGSGDDSLERLRRGVVERGYGDWVVLLDPVDNRGFAAGNNAALHHALEHLAEVEFFWLLNPDAAAHPGAVRALVEDLQAHPEAGMAGSAHVDGDGVPVTSAFRWHCWQNELDRALLFGPFTHLCKWWGKLVWLLPGGPSRTVDWLSGASLMVRRRVVEQIGLMDEGYFLYYEETDYCRRAWRAGWRCRLVQESVVTHLEGASTGGPSGPDGGPLPRIPRYRFESRRRYFVKHHGRIYAAWTDLCWLAGQVLRPLVRLLKPKTPRRHQRVLRDTLRFGALGFRGISQAPAVAPSTTPLAVVPLASGPAAGAPHGSVGGAAG